MPLLADEYNSSDEDGPITPAEQSTSAPPVVAAPEVSVDVWSHQDVSSKLYTNIVQDPMRLQLMLAKPTDTTIAYNVPYADLARAEQGPANPFKSTDGNALKRKNVLTGYAQETVISDATFSAQHRTFQSRGFAADPSAQGAYVGDLVSVQKHGGKDVVQKRHSKEESAALRRKRQKIGDASIVEGDGAYKGPWAGWQGDDEAYEDEAVIAGEELASDEEYVEEAIVPTKAPPMAKSGTDYLDDLSTSETTEFHGTEEHDYQGRTYMHVPQDLDVDLKKEPGTEKNYIPKKQIHIWKSRKL